MEFKIDTKEKFQLIQILTPAISANMADELLGCLTKTQQTDIKNIILDMQAVNQLSMEAAEVIVQVQQASYAANISLVVCGLSPGVEQFLEAAGLLELMNVTPTESEAMDIVHMEEIERELLGDGPM